MLVMVFGHLLGLLSVISTLCMIPVFLQDTFTSCILIYNILHISSSYFSVLIFSLNLILQIYLYGNYYYASLSLFFLIVLNT